MLKPAICPFVFLNNNGDYYRCYIVATIKIDQLDQLNPSFVQYIDIKVSIVIEKYLFDDIDIISKNTYKIYILKQVE